MGGKKKNSNFVFVIIFFLYNSGRAHVNRAGRKPVGAGCSTLRNRPSWNAGFKMERGGRRHRTNTGDPANDRHAGRTDGRRRSGRHLRVEWMSALEDLGVHRPDVLQADGANLQRTATGRLTQVRTELERTGAVFTKTCKPAPYWRPNPP